MRLRDFLVVLDGSARSKSVLALAVDLAQRHEAHVTGFCPLELLYPATLGSTLSGYPSPSALQDITDRFEADALDMADGIGKDFYEQIGRSNVAGNWQVASGSAAEAVAHRARTTDLLVMGQADPNHPFPPVARGLIENALMHSGRPVLLVPFAGRFDIVGRNVLLGWNGTPEAARAVHDALLLIEPAAIVTVLTVGYTRHASGTQTAPDAEIASHLERHGLKIGATRTIADGSVRDADALLNYASDIGADLLVVGGYGHSRAREIILGGVSRDLLDHMTLPVLMSH